MSTRSATPYHCPFCGEQDLRPDEQDPAAWVCRCCARVFSVTMVRFERTLVPGHVTASRGARS